MKSRHLLFSLIALVPFMLEGRAFKECQMIARDILGGDAMAQLRGKAKTEETPSEPFLVFSADSQPGFAVVSTDDRLPALIGYSHHYNFDSANMPPQLTAFLDVFTTAGVQPSSATFDDEEFVLPTAKFNQHEPFNNLCPAGTITGCGATAMAIKMAYHKWPDRGRGSHSYVSSSRGFNMQMDFDFSIDWGNILDDYDQGYTEAQAQAVARLMLACGVASEMDYDTNGSGAISSYVSNAMSKNFCYSPDCVLLTRSNFDEQQWHSMMRESLRDSGPVVYVGSGPYGGHAFIIDGYKQDYYHVNWGWGGLCDGYFLLSAMVPTDYANYNYRQSALLNVGPDYQKTSYCPFHLTKSDYDDLTPGLVSDMDCSTKGKFVVAARFLSNCDISSHKGTLAPLLIDDAGRVKAVLGNINVNFAPSSYLYFFSMDCRSDTEAAPGDKIILGYRESDSEPWIKVPGDGCANTEIDVFNNAPLMCPLTWRLDSSIKLNNNIIDDEALYDSHYSFTLLKDPNDPVITVTVNGVPINSIGSFGNVLFYDFAVDKYREYVIAAYPGEPVLMGDANGDGSVSVSDIVSVVWKIMEEENEYFDQKSADVNGDGVITVSDIVAIVDIILSNE